MEMEKGGEMKEDIARKYSAYFRSILHHNNGYFLQVKLKYGIEIQIEVFLLFQFLLCEFLNFIVDVFNIYLTDYFLGGRFIRLYCKPCLIV